MDGDRTKEAELRAAGGGKRTLREATKGTPPKPEPSRSRKDNSESIQPLGSDSEAVAGEPPRNSRCALYPAHVQLFRVDLPFYRPEPNLVDGVCVMFT